MFPHTDPAGIMVTQPAPGVNMSSMYPIQAHPGDHTVDRNHKAGTAKGLSLGLLPEENARQSQQVAQSYQKELEQQIREKNEKRRKERDEQERYDAKLEAEMKSYNPWGKGGGGAPLRDRKGNLITDLKRMHKENENSYQNPELQVFEDKRAVVAVDTSPADNTSSTGKIQAIHRSSSIHPQQYSSIHPQPSIHTQQYSSIHPSMLIHPSSAITHPSILSSTQPSIPNQKYPAIPSHTQPYSPVLGHTQPYHPYSFMLSHPIHTQPPPSTAHPSPFMLIHATSMPLQCLTKVL
ncbi:hypothetical protein AB205_0189990 [Aquarana catesbeiana]|uniref:Uncharacterized protein n=1 Tax=Aquarana catesbeiana TaxID=8400 RepID=A0A2G9S0K6_AQUCT|nr:hypothetical protein AB205_0189990 [Aquarana catesbeiana]